MSGPGFRERLLSRLRSGSAAPGGELFAGPEPRTSAPPPERQPELRARFAEALRKVGGEVHDLVECRDPASAFREVVRSLRGDREDTAPAPLAVMDRDPDWAGLRLAPSSSSGYGGEGPGQGPGVAEMVRESGFEVREVPETGGGNRELLARASLGITAADLAVAETGSVAQFTRSWRPRSISLLPPAHLVILRADRIVRSLGDLLARAAPELGGDTPYLTLITGPSRTSDIEKVLTIGVHGPGRVAVVVV